MTDLMKQAAITDWINQELDAAYDQLVAQKSIAMSDQPAVTFYSRTPLCGLCGQPCDRDQAAPFRTDQGDIVAHKDCLMRVQSGVWELLEAEGQGELRHFEDHGHDDLLPDDTHIRPYVVAPLDQVTPAAPLNKQWRDEPQQVHRS